MGQTVNLLAYAFGGSNPSLPTFKKSVPVGGCKTSVRRRAQGARREEGGWTLIRYIFAEVAQLIEHQPSKLRVASLSLVFRSEKRGYIVSMYPLFFISFLSIKISAM